MQLANVAGFCLATSISGGAVAQQPDETPPPSKGVVLGLTIGGGALVSYGTTLAVLGAALFADSEAHCTAFNSCDSLGHIVGQIWGFEALVFGAAIDIAGVVLLAIGNSKRVKRNEMLQRISLGFDPSNRRGTLSVSF